MSWYKFVRGFIPLFIGSLNFISCSSSGTSETAPVYFDLLGYFNQQSSQLHTRKMEVEKTIQKNGVKEQQHIQNINWKQELSLFMESDINKPSWSNSYATEHAGDTLRYITRDTTLLTRKIELIGAPKAVREIHIHNRVSNPLYTSDTHLSYFADSLYRMEKVQTVRFTGTNTYVVEGLIAPASKDTLPR